MLKKIRQFIYVLMGTSVGVYLGSSLWKWLDYRAHPDLYAMNSAPWYISLEIGAVFLAGALLLEGLALLFVNRLLKKRDNRNKGEDLK